MASSTNAAETVTQCKSTSGCRCGEGDSSLWTSRLGDNGEKQANKCPNCQVYKSGYLLLSSKGIGWTSWKKRWFILTRTSLVFFRSDPDSVPQKGNEGNLTLGGIDLNNSASIVVKADKKLLTVLFPDGREGRAFTLKAETSEDLLEWKTALENALAQAPSPALAMGSNGIFRNETAEVEPVEPSLEQVEKDKQPQQSTVIGQPVQVALEDGDGNPSFLEKALTFIEQHGIKVEGILRQSADVEEVERRVREYEQGKVEFSADEDAHVIGDCIKHVLRELPSSPVPAPCCTALVEAYRTDRGNRINVMRDAIYETFPEHNLRLLQRILKMMLTVASHKTQNRMSLSALAACMAPLLLRPLLAGDCEFDDNFSMGGDGSIQLLKAAAAANHAQAIVIILLEEYDKVFDEDLSHEGSLSSEIYSESEDGDFEDYESTDNECPDHDDDDDGRQEMEADIDDDPDHSTSGTISETSSIVERDRCDKKEKQNKASSKSKDKDVHETAATVTDTKVDISQKDGDHKLVSLNVPEEASSQKMESLPHENSNTLASPSSVSKESAGKFPSASAMLKSVSHNPSSAAQLTEKMNEPCLTKRPTVWGRTSARKNLSMESIELSSEDESAIEKLEDAKANLEDKIAKEVKGNTVLQASLEKRKEALHERRVALEQDVQRLKQQLQKERDLKASLESGLTNMQSGSNSYTLAADSKIRADLEEVALAEADIIALNEKVTDLRGQLNDEIQKSHAYLCQSCGRRLHDRDQPTKNDHQEVVERANNLDQNDESSKEANHPTEDDNFENQIQNSAPSGGQIPQKPKTNTTNEAGTKSKGSVVGRKTPSRKFSARLENVKKDPQDQSSLPNRQSFDRKITLTNSKDNASSSDNPKMAGTDGDTKRFSSRAEEVVSSSSALLKLTSRLNFLKERRAQLVNDIKNSEINRTLGLEGPLPGTNSK